MDLEIQLVNHKKVHKLQHHRMLQAAKEKDEKASKETSSTAEPPAAIAHPSAGYDLETAMESLEEKGPQTEQN